MSASAEAKGPALRGKATGTLVGPYWLSENLSEGEFSWLGRVRATTKATIVKTKGTRNWATITFQFLQLYSALLRNMA